MPGNNLCLRMGFRSVREWFLGGVDQIFADHASLVDVRIDVWTDLEQVILGLLGGHPLRMDEPAQGDCGAAGTTGFAMDVDLVSGSGDPVDELDPSFHVGQVRWVEVDSWEPQLLYFVMFIFANRPAILLAHIDDSTNPEIGQ